MRLPLIKSCMILLSICLCAHGQLNGDLDALEGVGIDEMLNASLPLELEFVSAEGKKVRLADLFNCKRAILLSLNYSDCPMLCQLQLNGLVDGLKELNWDVGEKFQICSVSINPLETPQRARQVKQRYLKSYGRPTNADGWEFLTGDQKSIEQLADAVGFRYKYVAEREEYAHSAAIMVCTPDGRVSRYLYGVLYPAQTLKLALVEAGQGKIGSTLDRVLLYCFHYDESSGRYAPVARRLMKLGAGMTLTTLAVGLIPVWLRRRQAATLKTSGEWEGAV